MLTHTDNAGAGRFTVYVEDVTWGCLDIGVGEGLRGDGCSAVGAELFLGSDFLLRGLRSGVYLVVVYCFEERSVRDGGGTTGYPVAVLTRQFGVALNEGADSISNICGGRGGGCRLLLGSFCGVGFVLGGGPRVLVLEGLNVEDAHQKAFSNRRTQQ